MNIDFDNLPAVLPQEIIDVLVPLVHAQAAEWHEISARLTGEQRSQVYKVVSEDRRKESDKKWANATQEEKDAFHRGAMIFGARDHWFVTIFDEYDLVNGIGHYNLTLEQIKESSPIGYAYKTIELRRNYMTPDEQFTFFTAGSPFTTCYPAAIIIDGLEFSSSHHYVVYKKAEQFLDRGKMPVILETTNKWDLEDLSHEVKYCEKQVWDMVLKPLLMTGIKEKFLQHDNLMQELLATKGTTLVLADKWNAKWGVGLDPGPRELNSRKTWPGKNLLGELLTEIRVEFAGSY